MLEFEAADPGPSHRVTGKQSPDPRLRIPLPVLTSTKGTRKEPDDQDEEPQDQPLPPIGADLSSLQHRETESHVTEDATVSAETGMAQTHVRRIGEEGPKKETHRDEATSVPGESVSQLRMSSLAAGGESFECSFARKQEEGPQRGHGDLQEEGLQRGHCDLQGKVHGGRRDLQQGLEACDGCGLLQVASKAKCGYCEAEIKQRIPDGLMQRWQVDMTSEEFGKLLEKEHVTLKKMLEEVGRELPVGKEHGRLHGEMVECLNNRLMNSEDLLRDLRGKEHGEKMEIYKMAAINETEMDKTGQAVLHTQTVSLSEVRKNLGEWREALLQEYRSLTEVNKAVKPMRKEDIQQRSDVEFAPGKLVATIKAPSGKKKARIVVCGNLVEPSLQEQEEEGEGSSTHGTRSKGYEHYASGIDGVVVRSVLRRASHCGWTGATTDVRTAFLLAPRRSKGGEKLVVRPPRILIESQIIDEGEWWEVEKALYGLQTSPADWSAFRDAELSKWSWRAGAKRFWLAATEEANLWQIRSVGQDNAEIKKGTNDSVVEGYVVVYVDDLLVLGEKPTVQAFLDQVRATWTCSEPEWIDDNLKFCGFEVTRRGAAICINQQAYAKELCARHDCRRSRPTPVSTTLAAVVSELDMDAPQSQNPGAVKRAQSLTGELLWLAVRTRPDLSYVVSLMGRLSTRHPDVAIQLGEEAIGYVLGTVGKGLEYEACEETRRHGSDSYLPFTRSMRRLECFADVSFAPNAGKSVQGIVAMYGGAPVQWESSRQSCIALSTAEGELYSYMEGVAMAESVGAILEILEEVPKRSGWKFPEQEIPDEGKYDQMEAWKQTPDHIQKILYGDSTAAIAVASTPDGTWRTRHLRLRCNGLRERIQQGSTWAIRHLPGTELVADFLTKPITVKARWPQFFAFMKMTSGGDNVTEGSSQDPVIGERKDGQGNDESWKQDVKKIALAGAGVAALSRLSPGNDEKLKMVKALSMGALAAFVAVKTIGLREKWKSLKGDEPRIQAVRMLPMGGSQRINPGMQTALILTMETTGNSLLIGGC